MILLALVSLETDAKPFEVRCKEPLPVFTLGEKSAPTNQQVNELCSCVWTSLKGWERDASTKVASGKEEELSFVHRRAFPARFAQRLDECGWRKL